MAAEMKINKKASGSKKKGLQHVNFRIVDYMETTESTDIFIRCPKHLGTKTF